MGEGAGQLHGGRPAGRLSPAPSTDASKSVLGPAGPSSRRHRNTRRSGRRPTSGDARRQLREVVPPAEPNHRVTRHRRRSGEQRPPENKLLAGNTQPVWPLTPCPLAEHGLRPFRPRAQRGISGPEHCVTAALIAAAPGSLRNHATRLGSPSCRPAAASSTPERPASTPLHRVQRQLRRPCDSCPARSARAMRTRTGQPWRWRDLASWYRLHFDVVMA